MGRLTTARKLFTGFGDDVVKRLRSTRRVTTLADDAIRTSAKGGVSKVLRGGSEIANKAAVKSKALLSRVRPSTIAKVGAVTGVAGIGLASFDPEFRRSVGDAIVNTTAAKRDRAASDRFSKESTFITDYLGAGGDVGAIPGILGNDGVGVADGSGFVKTANSPVGFVALAGLAGLGIYAYSKKNKK